MSDTTTRDGALGHNRPLALIAAGGEGRRLGSGRPKALVDCAGRSLLEWCLAGFAASRTFGDGAGTAVVAAHDSELDAFEAACEPARAAGLTVHVTAGGASRSQSVAAALRAGIEHSGEGGAVFVHDAARIFVSDRLIDSLAAQLAAESEAVDGLVAARAVTDTIKLVDANLKVTETPPRERLWAVQTPQVFRRAALAAALGIAEPVDEAELAAATDDASLIEARGGQIKVFEWTEPNDKITTTDDLAAAQLYLSRSAS
jgi:2-C-methyl-D-erythritol 4-phosphate cytidylyltransferase